MLPSVSSTTILRAAYPQKDCSKRAVGIQTSQWAASVAPASPYGDSQCTTTPTETVKSYDTEQSSWAQEHSSRTDWQPPTSSEIPGTAVLMEHEAQLKNRKALTVNTNVVYAGLGRASRPVESAEEVEPVSSESSELFEQHLRREDLTPFVPRDLFMTPLDTVGSCYSSPPMSAVSEQPLIDLTPSTYAHFSESDPFSITPASISNAIAGPAQLYADHSASLPLNIQHELLTVLQSFTSAIGAIAQKLEMRGEHEWKPRSGLGTLDFSKPAVSEEEHCGRRCQSEQPNSGRRTLVVEDRDK
ncbi:hypothetical protein LTR37_003827 [Vermiconidia calcicola]|uniref:Uncharacterized protein n=1 Tax=Vermiconidia calcicola TaxID=1690605 RepID=A0ACC3NP98_9PEZI|nr:hypothetical protein LTR37_003827 [Vermiconidia calcicola]